MISASPTQQIPAAKIHRLIAYLDNVGIDARQIACSVGIDIDEIIRTTAEQNIPSIYYALIYKESVSVLQQSGKPVVWAAGLGRRLRQLAHHYHSVVRLSVVRLLF